MTFAISIGKWGGFYKSFKHNWRICLGFVAFTVLFVDIAEVLDVLDKVAKAVRAIDAQKPENTVEIEGDNQ
ncbi:MAG: hypothetical protein ACYDH2_12265 [Anaerolineaceae bacterium]